MNLYEAFETDPAKESDGTLINMEGLGKIWVARAGGTNARFAEALEKATKPYRFGGVNLDPATERGILVGVYADTIVTKWEGIKGRDGRELEFSRENVIQVLTDLPDLFAFVRQVAGNGDSYRKAVAEETGNA